MSNVVKSSREVYRCQAVKWAPWQLACRTFILSRYFARFCTFLFKFIQNQRTKNMTIVINESCIISNACYSFWVHWERETSKVLQRSDTGTIMTTHGNEGKWISPNVVIFWWLPTDADEWHFIFISFLISEPVPVLFLVR